MKRTFPNIWKVDKKIQEVKASAYIFIYISLLKPLGFPGGSVVENLPANAGSVLGKIPWRRKQQSTLVFLPGKFHGQGSLMGYWEAQPFRHDWAQRHAPIFNIKTFQYLIKGWAVSNHHNKRGFQNHMYPSPLLLPPWASCLITCGRVPFPHLINWYENIDRRFFLEH